jgi:hypothetical protein
MPLLRGSSGIRVPIVLTQLKPQQLDQRTVDIDQPDAKVAVFCE